MEYEIRYYSEAVQDEILDLPDTLAARYVVLTRRMVALGANLGEAHTKAMKGGLFELRLKEVRKSLFGVLLHAGGPTDRDVAQFCKEDQPHIRARVGHCDESLERGET